MTQGSDARRMLRWLHAKAELTLARLPELPGDHPALPRRREIARLATELAERARLPITIGLVGEHSVGKSELFNALLGHPGLLYVSPAPATGNVTAIVLKSPRPGRRPAEPFVTISYMSWYELADAAQYMLGKLVELVRTEELHYDVDALADGYNPVTDGFGTLEKLARPWWDETRNVALQMHAWELFRIRNAIAAGEALLDEDKPSLPIRVEPEDLQAAIKIGNAREVPRKFPAPADQRPVRRGASLSMTALRDTFPLIHRVTYEVEVEPDLWDLGGLRASNGVVFLDFPGLNAPGGSRDEFLCRNELKTLTSFVEVLAAPRPENKTAAIFATMLQARRRSSRYLDESVLLAANMFDQLKDVPQVAAAIDLSELREDSELLDSLFRILGELCQDDWSRVAFTSAVPGTPDTRWQPVARALEAGGAMAVAAAFRGYLADGGVSRLRAMIADQIAAKAMPIEVDELLAKRDFLVAELAKLRDLLEPPAVGHASDEAERRLAELLVALGDTAIELRGGAAVFRDLKSIAVDSADTFRGGEVDVLTRISQAAVAAVYASPPWASLWRKLLLAVQRQDGEIPFQGMPDKSKVEKGRPDWSKRRGKLAQAENDPAPVQDDQLPVSTEDFRALFTASLAELGGEARELASQVLAEWVASYDHRLAKIRRQLTDTETQALLIGRLAVLDPGDRGARRLSDLHRIVELDWVPGWFEDAMEQVEESAETEGANRFPLAQDQALPWHGHLASIEAVQPELHVRRHHSTVERLRYDLAEGLAFPVQTAVAAAFGHLAIRLHAEFEKLIGRIPFYTDLVAAGACEPADEQAGQGAGGVLAELIRELSEQPEGA